MSRGLGAEIACALAGEGWTVALNYAHDDKGAQDVAAAIRKNGGRAPATWFDVTEATAEIAAMAPNTQATTPIPSDPFFRLDHFP